MTNVMGGGVISLSGATCEVLTALIVQSPTGQALLSAVRGEHGIPPGQEMVLQLTAWLMPKAMLEEKPELPKATVPPVNRAERRRRK